MTNGRYQQVYDTLATADAFAWQDSVFNLIASRLTNGAFQKLREIYTPRGFNMEFGIRVHMGKRAGHSTLARRILENLDAVLVVPTDGGQGTPYSDKQRHIAELKKLDLEHFGHHIWVSRPLDIAPMRGGIDLTRQDVLEKTFDPLKNKTVCVVDAASRLSEDELEVLRSTSWHAYVELG